MMIITRTPFRVSFAGGGSDLARFYRREPGAVVSVTIDKYMYVMLHENFVRNQLLLKYAKTEVAEIADAIAHPIFRQVLSDYRLTGVEIALSADVPAGTGLGSSSALSVGLHQNIGIFVGAFRTKEQLAQLACETEIVKLGKPIGKQDQYAAAYGGLNYIEFNPDESVTVEKLLVNSLQRRRLEQSLVLIYTGISSHVAEKLLVHVTRALDDEAQFRRMSSLVGLARHLRNEVAGGCDPAVIGEILHEGWRLKRGFAAGISTGAIDDIYSAAMRHGALGGKLLGAGGAGFLLLVCNPADREKLLRGLGQFRQLPFRFETQGSAVVYVSDDAADYGREVSERLYLSEARYA